MVVTGGFILTIDTISIQTSTIAIKCGKISITSVLRRKNKFGIGTPDILNWLLEMNRIHNRIHFKPVGDWIFHDGYFHSKKF